MAHEFHDQRSLLPWGYVGRCTTFNTTAGALNVAQNIYFATNADHYAYFGTTTGNNGYIYANTADALPYLKLVGAGDIEAHVTSYFAVADGTAEFARLQRTTSKFTQTETTDRNFWILGSNQTGGCLHVDDQALTTGDAVYISVNSTTCTTGNAIGVVSGPSGTTYVFKVTDDANVFMVNWDPSTGGDPTKDSPYISMTGSYWTGAASSEVPFLIYNDVFSTTAPRGRLRLSSGGYTASIVPASTGAVYQGGPNTGNSVILKANETDTYPFITLVGDDNVYVDMATGDSFNLRYGGGAAVVSMSASSWSVSPTMVSGDTITVYPASQTGGNTFTITNPTMTNGNILRLIGDSDNLTGKFINCFSGPSSANSVWSVDARGNTILTNWEPSDAGTTTQDSPYIDMFGSYWTGAISSDYKMRLQVDVYSTAAPYGQLKISNTPGNVTIIRPTAAGCDYYGGDAAGETATFYANSADTYGRLILDGDADSSIALATGASLMLSEGATTLANLNLSGTTWYSDVATGTAWLSNWQTVNPTTGNIIGHHIDASTSITFGVDLGATALKLTSRTPNGNGTSYLIDGNNESGQTFYVKSDGTVSCAESITLGTSSVYGGGQTEIIPDPVETTDETVTTCGSVTLTDDSAYLIEARVIGMQSDGSSRNVYHIEGLFYRDGGNATQQGATTSITTIESEALCDCVFDTDTNDVRVRVTGVAAETWHWKTVLKYHKVG